ncbi:bis(5'-nucleosyl)-tetraphosphatase (symmetrical) YqeK [Vallitalea guaymasensis]|uniref:Ribosomal silencing factor RsfS n=1 Tax=Vallitalea guaymasensis TaxID=1185412 RepID=A0A8J8MEV8_9FIRM|nr:bis(5'-nucleosyl)-tetraphosphatase (symmetrical) YqeK [Vallitalea guaymasensis]QUH31641.1 bis(5'-nucleosyl)-tetraphosphatase (symmetrical) YqeK [Vallitalea guaymasensis]
MQNNYNITGIRNHLLKQLSENRYEHTLGVEKTAVSLAKLYNVDIEKARVAALLHDCAKNLSDDKKLELCEKYNIEVTEEQKKNLDLIHAEIGSVMAKYEYEIDDEDILNAITYHTTGKPNMSNLEKIIYVSDYIEPGRTKAPNLDEIRRVVMKDLDKALYMILSDTINYLKTSKKYIVPTTMEAYEYYKNILDTTGEINMEKNTDNSMDLLKTALKALDDKLAEDIQVLDIRDLTVIADYFIIAHGNNKSHIKALIDRTDEVLSKNGYEPKQVEGYNSASWILLDYGNIIIHIFSKEDRLFYDLERIWSDGKKIDVKSLIED